MQTEDPEVIDALIRRLVREEIRRVVKPDALEPFTSNYEDEHELRHRASGVASRLRRARHG